MEEALRLVFQENYPAATAGFTLNAIKKNVIPPSTMKNTLKRMKRKGVNGVMPALGRKQVRILVVRFSFEVPQLLTFLLGTVPVPTEVGTNLGR
jgi:hypothetical protein